MHTAGSAHTRKIYGAAAGAGHVYVRTNALHYSSRGEWKNTVRLGLARNPLFCIQGLVHSYRRLGSVGSGLMWAGGKVRMARICMHVHMSGTLQFRNVL